MNPYIWPDSNFSVASRRALTDHCYLKKTSVQPLILLANPYFCTTKVSPCGRRCCRRCWCQGNERVSQALLGSSCVLSGTSVRQAFTHTEILPRKQPRQLDFCCYRCSSEEGFPPS